MEYWSAFAFFFEIVIVLALPSAPRETCRRMGVMAFSRH